MNEQIFGPYIVTRDGNQATIRRADGSPAQPTWYEMQHMKSLAFGARAVAVEVYPDMRQIVDGQNQRHLWRVAPSMVPNLCTGAGIEHDGNGIV